MSYTIHPRDEKCKPVPQKSSKKTALELVSASFGFLSPSSTLISARFYLAPGIRFRVLAQQNAGAALPVSVRANAAHYDSAGRRLPGPFSHPASFFSARPLFFRGTACIFRPQGV